MVKRFAYIVLATLLLTGCEVIRENEQLIELPVPVPASEQKHVLIEFTGFRCVNCPKAAEMAQSMLDVYGQQLIVVAMHPASNPFTQGLYDYTCPAADVYYQAMGGSASTPFPTGNIDMRADEGNYFLDYTEWPARIASALSTDHHVALSTEAVLESTSRQISVTTTYRGELAQEARLMIWLMEDSVKGVQAMPDGSVNTNYYHRHMLRAVADEAWGKAISIPVFPEQSTTAMPLPEGCIADQCEIIAVIIDEDKHILNASTCKLTQQ